MRIEYYDEPNREYGRFCEVATISKTVLNIIDMRVPVQDLPQCYGNKFAEVFRSKHGIKEPVGIVVKIKYCKEIRELKNERKEND